MFDQLFMILGFPRLLSSSYLRLSCCFFSLAGLIWFTPSHAAENQVPFWPAELNVLPLATTRVQQGTSDPNPDFIRWQQQGRNSLRQSYLWPEPLPEVVSKRMS
ncbi:MAG: hypothetical protein KKB45_18725, partial [Gammaproteobacteria bacterium]|nr:hypothetical protein [Gammaproteobacteria bacterium]